MASMEQPFLAGDEAERGNRSARRWPSVHAWVLMAAVAGVLAVASFVGGTQFGRQTPHLHAAYGVPLPLGNGTSPIAATLAEKSEMDCYAYTGGTCGVNPCYDWRDAECRDGYCVCENSCSGADGKCYQGRYKNVATGFTLTNAKYTGQMMYMPAAAPLNSIKTTAFPSSLNGGKDKFTLYRLPGNLSGHKAYFLSTVRYSEYTVSIQATMGTALSPFGAYEVGMAKAESPQKLAVRVCSKGDGSVMMAGQSLVGTTEWFYIHHLSWIVYGYSFGDPGAGGVWKADPPIPEDELEPCEF